MGKIYVDTNIFMDFWFDRSSRVQPFGLFAKNLFDETKECKFFLIVSNFTLKEIELNVKFPGVVEEFFEGFRKLGKLKIVKILDSTIDSAKKLKINAPIHDRIHALIAKQEKSILVTRDKHFKQFEDRLNLDVRTPEQL